MSCVKCERDCKKRGENKECILEEIQINQEGGCSQYIKVPGFEPFRADNVVVFDKAGIPSIMIKFSRITNAELFGGSDKPHPAFIIDGEIYDEIYVSKYPNVTINGKAYSLPMQEPTTNVTYDEAQKMCRAKGEGWHLWTAAERGLIANLCAKTGVFPHGNTSFGTYHKDSTEKGVSCQRGGKTITGSGPATWNHDHTPFGVSDLCGNIYEWFAGMRLKDGVLETIPDNNAASNVDMSADSKEWKPLEVEEKPIRINAENGGIKFTTEKSDVDYDGCEWQDAEFDFEITEEMKELALFPGEAEAYIYADTEGERLPRAGGYWHNGAYAGVFCVHLYSPRSLSGSYLGFRSAYYRKLDTED